MSDRRFRLPPSWWLGLLVVLLAASGPATAGAQILEPPCVNSMPDGPEPDAGASTSATLMSDPCPPPDTGGAPPLVTITPRTSDGSFSPPVQVEYCGEHSYANHQAYLNGRDITAQLQFAASGGGGKVPLCANKQVATATLQLEPTDNRFTVRACDAFKCGSDSVSYLLVPPFVSPAAGQVALAAQVVGVELFQVANNLDSSVTLDVSPLCTGVSCSPPVLCYGAGLCGMQSVSTITLAAGEYQTLGVSHGGLTAGASATVRLVAKYAQDFLADTGVVTVGYGDSDAPAIRPYATSGTGVISRDNCLTIPLGDDLAAECGDLRSTWALPSVRTYGKVRTPVLLYSSHTAAPRPIVSARVTASNAGQPDQVQAALFVGGATVASGTWAGSDFPPTHERHIALAMDASAYATGVYPYTLEVTAMYAGSPRRSRVSGKLIVVNRAMAPFGPGWSLAGHEQLLVADKLWIGGDGSAHVYEPVPGRADAWTAPASNVGDTLLATATGYERRIPGNVKVLFDATGRHVATLDRLGRETRFAYDTDGHLAEVTGPPLTSALTWYFDYAAGLLGAVRAPGVTATTSRTISFGRSGRQLTSVTDLDGSVVQLGYRPGTNLLESRINRLGNAVTIAYDAGQKVSSATTGMGQAPAIVVTYRAAESVSLPIAGHWSTAAVADSVVYSLLDGPRLDSDVLDRTRFWLSEFGMPRQIEDALARRSTVAYDDPRWPALATRSSTPNGTPGGRVQATRYDRLGLAYFQVDSATWVENAGVRTYAKTRYEWDRRWREPTKVVPPMGDSTSYAYEPSSGVRVSMIDARGSKVRFRYNWQHLLTSIVTPLASKPVADPYRDSLEYDGLGNLYARVSPNGVATTYIHDRIGRIYRTEVPIGSAQQSRGPNAGNTRDTRVTRKEFDVMGRDSVTSIDGPANTFTGDPIAAQTITWPAGTLRVAVLYDREGNDTLIIRSASPDPEAIGEMKLRRVFDAAGRLVAEHAPDSYAGHIRRDSTRYDAAGNPVWSLTRRGHVITARFDALNRLHIRDVPAVDYPQYGQTFPRKDQNASMGYSIPTGADTFTYAASGGISTANNADARVTRQYLPNGLLKSEEQRVRTYSGNDFDRHVYLLEYAYDLNGRRTSLRHPEQLLNMVNKQGVLQGRPAGWTDRTSYAYNDIGALASLTNPMQKTFSFFYDEEGRLDSLVYPNQVWEARHYDEEGREWRTNQGRPVGYWLRTMSRKFTEDGRIFEVRENNDDFIYRMYYTGQGALGWYDSNYRLNATDYRRVLTEWSHFDALGHQRSRTNSVRFEPLAYTEMLFDHEARTGRITAERFNDGGLPAGEGVQQGALEYDVSGNLDYDGRRMHANNCGSWIGECSAWFQHEFTNNRKYYYAADQKLRAVDIYNPDACPIESTASGFENYRYDALGRRVLRRYRSDLFKRGTCTATAPIVSYSFLERVVHDGDQILYEVRAPGEELNPTLYPDMMETDHSDRYFDVPDLWQEQVLGRVAYTHGLGIDEVLSVTRVGIINASAENRTLYLHRNWRGQYTKGSEDAGLGTCYADGKCDKVDFRGEDVTGWLAKSRPPTGDGALNYWWMGSFLSLKADRSGQIFMRNRYYDAQTGRFTQEDPIGLAGGINLYAFGGSDPVNYSDPFGLCPECRMGWGSPTAENVEKETRYYESLTNADRVGMAAIGGAAVAGGFAALAGGSTLFAMTVARFAPVGVAVGKSTERLIRSVQQAGTSMDGRMTAVAKWLPSGQKARLSPLEGDAMMMSGGTGPGARQVILYPNGTTVIKALNVSKKIYETVATITPSAK